MNSGEGLKLAFLAKRSVPQGCPLSAALFVIVLNPFSFGFSEVFGF